MKDIKVKEVMIPISNYVTVEQSDSLVGVLQALEAALQSKSEHAHRDAIVVDENGVFTGKVTMLDLFRAMEPNYKEVDLHQKKGVLTEDFVMKSVKDFALWMEPTKSICERGVSLRVSEVMHTPEKTEYIQEDDTLEKALHLYVMEVHQPLIVKNGNTVTGILRFGDLFETIRKDLLSCAPSDHK